MTGHSRLLKQKSVLLELCAKLLGDLAGGVERGIRQHDQKFLAANAPDGIGLAKVVAQAARDTDEYAIAECMTVGVVDSLEVIRVNDYARRTMMIGSLLRTVSRRSRTFFAG